MRTDAQKNIAKVAGELAKDPLKTEREIASQTGIGKSTVNRAKQELGQSGAIDKTDQVIRIAERDLLAVERIQTLEEEHLEEYLSKAAKGEFMKVGELEAVNRIGERKQRRASLLLGDATDSNGGLSINMEQKEQARSMLSKLLGG